MSTAARQRALRELYRDHAGMAEPTGPTINYTHPGRTTAPAPVVAPVRRTVVLRAGESMVIARVAQ